MTTSKWGFWHKFGRFITGITIACFFLPFFGVSCGGMDVVTVSGADMVGGCAPGGLIADAKDKAETRGGRASDAMSGDIKLDKVPREPLAIVAMVLAVGIFGLSWVRTRGALLGALVLSIACLGALTGLYLKVGGELSDIVDNEIKKESDGGPAAQEMMKEANIEAGARWGLWLAAAGLIATAVFCGRALKEPGAALPSAGAMPPQQPPPAA